MTRDRDPRTKDFALDVPEADALEQHRAADEDLAPDDESIERLDIAPDVPEADAVEQLREAGLDDDRA
ncbi:MAG TPA: hypothetical protein VM784_13555 [Actinomycetota bacterium]|nr:hypothetical protein [Actinomycetota bacterium]